MPPVGDPIIIPAGIALTCGQDITVPSFEGVALLIMSCAKFNGSETLTMEIYKDGELISNSLSQGFTPPTDDNFGTYTFALSTEKCGTAIAVSRILRQGQFTFLK